MLNLRPLPSPARFVAFAFVLLRAASAIASPPTGEHVWLVIGSDLAPAAADRLKALITHVAPDTVVLGPTDTLPKENSGLVISLGDSTITEELITRAELDAVGAEGFIVKAHNDGGLQILAADGNAAGDEVASAKTEVASTKNEVARAKNDISNPNMKRGAAYGAYAALEELGFAFLHPLSPILPAHVTLARSEFTRSEKPRWPERGLHLHTMHPIELSHLLNGWGPDSPCGLGATLTCDDTTWDPLEQAQWEPYLEWMTANRQNMVEWVLLQTKGAYENYANHPTLARRLAKLVARAHAWDVRAGIDVPIALEQQNGWRLVRSALDPKKHSEGDINADYHNQINQNLDFIMSAHFDFIGTEMGFSEFTSPSDTLMLDWINAAAEHLRTRYGVRLSVKSHVSQGQTAEHYKDWDTGKPLNFNYLTDQADADVIVLPHTVEAYSLTDPAPTYGNQSFADMHRFIKHESFTRDSIWYPETAYWVSVDSDVPLFLPIYPERRIADLRMLAREQDAGVIGPHLRGQLIFSSGWEWGYWLNDLIAARAAWNPHMEVATDGQAFQAALNDALRGFGAAAAPLAADIANLAGVQGDELIFGTPDGGRPSWKTTSAPVDPRATGFAYLSGVDTWDEISFLANDVTHKVSTTQPRRIPLGGLHFEDEIFYAKTVRPLLSEIPLTHKAALDSMEQLAGSVPQTAQREFQDLHDSLKMTWLRATQVSDLYASAYHIDRNGISGAQAALNQALGIVTQREPAYRVDPKLIASWGTNPTVYPFGYIWTIHSLFYWQRDQGILNQHPKTLCFFNVLNPANVALADGTQDRAYQVIQDFKYLLGDIDECLAPRITSEASFQHAIFNDR